MRVDRRIQFEYATCERGNFESGNKKLRVQKYPVWPEPKFIREKAVKLMDDYKKKRKIDLNLFCVRVCEPK